MLIKLAIAVNAESLDDLGCAVQEGRGDPKLAISALVADLQAMTGRVGAWTGELNKILIGAMLVTLVGCTTTPVMLRYLDGSVIQCGPYDGRPGVAAVSAAREAQCINDHRAQGAVRI